MPPSTSNHNHLLSLKFSMDKSRFRRREKTNQTIEARSTLIQESKPCNTDNYCHVIIASNRRNNTRRAEFSLIWFRGQVNYVDCLQTCIMGVKHYIRNVKDVEINENILVKKR